MRIEGRITVCPRDVMVLDQNRQSPGVKRVVLRLKATAIELGELLLTWSIDLKSMSTPPSQDRGWLITVDPRRSGVHA